MYMPGEEREKEGEERDDRRSRHRVQRAQDFTRNVAVGSFAVRGWDLGLGDFLYSSIVPVRDRTRKPTFSIS